eukprot:CAMPEP_0117689344 /NCGR_PEP_ID=MMETSP0804-20121206/24428_1 /TAXON_ID=1074897 /ORGANISM="Tetraselmis astigmatica, Strain CCMP880" /LENGTH=39 /DNA_ID= /DNA_START= /DNA_END= /DNA_ORIENTATION=
MNTQEITTTTPVCTAGGVGRIACQKQAGGGAGNCASYTV